jgi:hypothetical protein
MIEGPQKELEGKGEEGSGKRGGCAEQHFLARYSVHTRLLHFWGVHHPVRVMSLFEVPPGRYGEFGGIDERIGPGTSFFLSRVHSMRLIRIGQIVRSSS